MEWIALLLILWIISSFLYHKSLAKDSKRFYESDLPIEPQPTIVDDILGNCVLPPIVRPYKPYKRPVDQSVNPFDSQYQIAEPIKRLSNQFMSAQDKYAYMFSLTSGSTCVQQYLNVTIIFVNLVDLSTILDVIILTILCLVTNLYII